MAKQKTFWACIDDIERQHLWTRMMFINDSRSACGIKRWNERLVTRRSADKCLNCLRAIEE